MHSTPRAGHDAPAGQSPDSEGPTVPPEDPAFERPGTATGQTVGHRADDDEYGGRTDQVGTAAIRNARPLRPVLKPDDKR